MIVVVGTVAADRLRVKMTFLRQRQNILNEPAQLFDYREN